MTFRTIAIAIAVLFTFHKCADPILEERTNFQELIGEYLENNYEVYSQWISILYKSESMSFLKAYGGYTLMAPTNKAIDEYLEELGVSSIDDISKEELKDLVRYHVIKDTLNSTVFVDGRMETPNMFGHYITTGTYIEQGEAVIKLNKYAPIEEKDIRLSNGIIHKITSVIRPEMQTAANAIESTGNYSIFVEALKQTGWYDTLQIKEGPHTVFVIPDDVYAKEGFTSFEDLLNDIAPGTENLTDTLNEMNKYVGYHILDDNLRYVTDLINDRAALTKAHKEVITIRMSNGNVLINDDIFAGVHEPGFEIERVEADRTVLNGVLHEMKADFRIKERFPFAVYWEVTDQLEIRKMPGVFRRPGSTEISNGQLENITWHGENNKIYYNGGLSGVEAWAVFKDRLDVNLRPEVIQWVEFKTPILVAGRYKMWVCTRNVHGDNNRKAIYYAYFNDIAFPNIINNRITLNNTTPEHQFEMEGFKLYGWRPADLTSTREVDGERLNITQLNYMNKEGAERMTGQLAGVVDIETTGIHTVKFVGMTGTNGAWFDMIHFIPVDEDQLWPRINIDTGELIYKEEINQQYQEYLDSLESENGEE